MVNAGFYYLGRSDRVACFYCGGRLKEWQPSDNPWFEHAKWFLLCKYVLQKQGVDYVKKVCREQPKLNRPPLANPSTSNSTQSIRNILNRHVTAGAKMTDPRAEKRKQAKEELEILMLLDPDVNYAKNIGIEEEKLDVH